MGLFTPYLSDNRNIAMTAIKRLNDEKKLFQAATSSKIKDVQKIAVSKISDQDMLYEIADSTTCLCREDALAKLDEEHLIRFVKESSRDGLKENAVKSIHNQEFLLYLVNNSDNNYIRANAIANLDDDHVDNNRMKDIAINAVSESGYPAPDATAAIDRIKDEKVLLEIALSKSRGHLHAAECLKTEEALAEFLINTKSEIEFNFLAHKITDYECKEKIIKEAKIRNPKCLNNILSPKELLEKCLKNKAPKLVEGCFEASWNPKELNQLRELSKDDKIREKIDLRIKTAEQFEILKSKGYPVVINEDTNKFIEALNKEIALYDTVKTTIKNQGRSIAFDYIYEKSGTELEQAIMQGCGLSITYFLGGPLVGGFMLIGPDIKLSERADEAVWAVVASLQLAEEETVLSRLSAIISKEEAASLIHDIVKLWYDKMP